MLYPASPSLQWVLWAEVPHLHSQDTLPLVLRYYDPLRLPEAYLVVVRSSLSFHDTLYCPSLFVTPIGLIHKAGPLNGCLEFKRFLLPYCTRAQLALPSSRVIPVNA
jgi:hypothetical protein